MKTIILGSPSGIPMDRIMSVYPRHKVVVDKYVSAGHVVGIGRFDNFGNMAIFRTRDAAEAFAREDPFILEGIVKSVEIRDWDDNMIE